MQTVDPDDKATWPQALHKWLHSHSRLGECVPSLFAAARLRAYHCTRLLEHEVSGIRRQGLRRLTPELLVNRLEDACAHAAITHEEAAALGAADVMARVLESNFWLAGI